MSAYHDTQDFFTSERFVEVIATAIEDKNQPIPPTQYTTCRVFIRFGIPRNDQIDKCFNVCQQQINHFAKTFSELLMVEWTAKHEIATCMLTSKWHIAHAKSQTFDFRLLFACDIQICRSLDSIILHWPIGVFAVIVMYSLNGGRIGDINVLCCCLPVHQIAK